MMKFLAVAFLSLILVSCEQKPQPVDKDKERIDKVCDTFMQLFADGKMNDALELLKKNSVMAPATIDTLRVTIDKQANYYFPSYGKMLNAEFITDRKIKDFISKRFYILRFDKYYLKFDFILYKTSSGWTITSFKYNEDLIELLY